MQRLLIIYNPNSSQYVHVKEEVLSRTTNLKGFVVGKFEIIKTDFNKNVTRLIKVLRNDDLVLAVGGDATAAVAANAIIESKKDATLTVLPYGNFNDLARTLGTMKYEDILKYLQQTAKPNGDHQDTSRSKKHGKASCRRLYPLDIIVDGQHWRYATCYVTMGMTAEAVELFDRPKIRQSLQKGHKSSWRSYLYLMKWYFRNRHTKVFIPEFTINGKKTSTKISDYAAVNGRSMCRVMKGGDYYLKPKVFQSENCRLTNFWRLFKLMTAAILVRTPGTETKGDTIEFIRPATVELQAEGEYQVFKNIEKIEIKKGNACLKVIQN